METKQRRAVALAQRQESVEAQPLRLLIAEIRCQQCAQLADGRRDHHLPRRHLAFQLAAERRRQTHRQKRMAAEGEEIGVDIVHLAAQQLAERCGNGSFNARLRRTTAAYAAQRRQRQRFTIQLAVSAQRQRRQLNQHHRHHMRRQLFAKPRFERDGVQRQA